MKDEERRRPDPVARFTGSVPAPTGHQTSARRLGDAMRALIDRLAGVDAPAEELEHAAEQVEALAQVFARYPQNRLYEGFAESANAGTAEALFDHSPMLGPANPLAPPLRLHPDGNGAAGSVTFGSAYEGPPGCVHGGYVAAAFDELLGMVQSLTGNPGMTGTLVVRYRKPTPLHEPLRFEGEVVRVEGRKIFTTGRCLHDGTVTAEAEAIFISIDAGRMVELAEVREQRRSGTGPVTGHEAQEGVAVAGRLDRPDTGKA